MRELLLLIQDARHKAELTTARCARDNEWDLEAYYRAKAEGLQEAEKIVEEYYGSELANL